jgi:hypothetical protein
LVLVLLLLFGSKQIPQIARQLGRSVREVKETVANIDPREDGHEAPRGAGRRVERRTLVRGLAPDEGPEALVLFAAGRATLKVGAQAGECGVRVGAC